MARVDLNVHSKYSDKPTDWILQKLRTSESFTDPELIYHAAKKRGMDFVTITDSDSLSGSLVLKEKFPNDTFTGVEVTSYFPEDYCKVHILVYGITEQQFYEMNKLRENVYNLRDYIKANNLAYSVAYTSHYPTSTMKAEHLEKLILLFDVFEVRNGLTNERNNHSWSRFLHDLTQADLDFLRDKHDIEPFGQKSWIKGFTGGSDDHAGIFIGKTYTVAEAETADQLLSNLRCKSTSEGGRHNDFTSMAFYLTKLIYDFAKTRSNTLSTTKFVDLMEIIFQNKKLGLREKLALRWLPKKRKGKADEVKLYVADLIEEMSNIEADEIDRKIAIVYEKVKIISEGFLKRIVQSLIKDPEKSNIAQYLTALSSFLPSIFLYVPYLIAFRLMSGNRKLLQDVYNSIGKSSPERQKNSMVFRCLNFP